GEEVVGPLELEVGAAEDGLRHLPRAAEEDLFEQLRVEPGGLGDDVEERGDLGRHPLGDLHPQRREEEQDQAHGDERGPGVAGQLADEDQGHGSSWRTAPRERAVAGNVGDDPQITQRTQITKPEDAAGVFLSSNLCPLCNLWIISSGRLRASPRPAHAGPSAYPWYFR